MDRRYIKKMERYWNKETAKTQQEINDLDFNSWFNYWHTHPDWSGKGNINTEMNDWVLQITYDFLKAIESKTKSYSEKIQIWAIICEDSGENAIYIHSENPHTPFPESFEKVVWNVEVPLNISKIIDSSIHEVGRVIYDTEAVYYLRALKLA